MQSEYPPLYAQPPVPSSATIRVPIKADWIRIMKDGLFECFGDIETATCSFFCAPCLAGSNQEKIGNNCCANCFCYFIFCGCQRSSIQRVLLGADADEGCMMGCIYHAFCGCCARAQEARAINAWIIAGKPTRMEVPAALQMTQ